MNFVKVFVRNDVSLKATNSMFNFKHTHCYFTLIIYKIFGNDMATQPLQ